jgi:hypothetical protein
MDVLVVRNLVIAFCLCYASHENQQEISTQQDTLSSISTSVASGEFTVRMPNVQPLKKDTYLCSSHRLPHPEKKQYIVEIEPHASEATAHHMLLFGCRLPFQSGSWNCGDMGGGVCLRGSRILFGWAKNAQGIEMPSGTWARLTQVSLEEFVKLIVLFRCWLCCRRRH